MTQEQVILLAREALKHDPGFAAWTLSTPHLEIIVNMAIKIEREACAKVCEENLRDEYLRQARPIQEEVMLLAAIADCAAAIRARGQ